MAKFVIVDKAPEKLSKDECVIEMPNFIKEIEMSSKKATKKNGINGTSLYHLKEIMGNIAREYAPEEMNHIVLFPYSKYEGVGYEDNEGLSKIIIKMLNKHYPDIFAKTIDKHVKNRAKDAKTVYFVGPTDFASVFINNGLDQENAKKDN